MNTIQKAAATKQTISRLVAEAWPGLDETERAIALFDWHQWVFNKLAHPNIWQQMQLSYRVVEPETIRARVEALATAGKPLYDAFIFPGLRLLQADTFRLTDLNEELPFKGREKRHYLAGIREAIESQTPFTISWSDQTYDSSIVLKWQDGAFLGWYKQYYRDSLHGHTWMVIHPTTALYYQCT